MQPLRLEALCSQCSSRPTEALAQLVRQFLDRYCGTLAVESGHLSCESQRHWVQAAVESQTYAPTAAQQRHVLKALVHADRLERFLAQRFPSSKRFGIEGCEAAIPGLLALCAAFAEGGGRRVELAMAHRCVYWFGDKYCKVPALNIWAFFCVSYMAGYMAGCVPGCVAGYAVVTYILYVHPYAYSCAASAHNHSVLEVRKGAPRAPA